MSRGSDVKGERAVFPAYSSLRFLADAAWYELLAHALRMPGRVGFPGVVAARRRFKRKPPVPVTVVGDFGPG